jgi:tRNA threonylcarbamoyladenosine biosynthesis protein TsaB
VKLLAIETATPCAGCALWEESGLVASFMLAGRQRHAEVLMPAVDELCRWAGWSAADLTGVAVDRGPGLFTGLRVGLATARAIAMARGIPAAGVTSLEVLAHPYRRRAGLLSPVVDARRGQVYWALYEMGAAGAEEVRPPAVAGPEELAAALAGLGRPVLAVGDGAWRYREQLVAAGVEVGGRGEIWPSALAVAELGAQRLSEGTAGEGGLPEPLYLRPPDVRIGWEEVGGRVGGGRVGGGRMGGQMGGPSAVRPDGLGAGGWPGPGATPMAATGGRATASPPEEPKLAP